MHCTNICHFTFTNLSHFHSSSWLTGHSAKRRNNQGILYKEVNCISLKEFLDKMINKCIEVSFFTVYMHRCIGAVQK